MRIKIMLNSWKYPSILLFGIGISNIGDWIYFIALNLIVLDMTGSALAVSALYILKPLATLFTNLWAGSIIDRVNKRKVMIILDLIRGILIGCMPLLNNIWLIYLLVFFVNMASAMFRPTSSTYITKLIPIESRKRFNSFHSLIQSGAFVIGPAVAGLLFLVGSPTLAIYINAIALLLSALVTKFMPDLEEHEEQNEREHTPISFALLKEDWSLVKKFSLGNTYITLIYLLFSFVLVVMATGLDSLEAAFAKEIFSLNNGEYGFLVSIAGIGILVGASVNTLFVRKLSTSFLMGIGSVCVSGGYIFYAFSNSFMMAAVGFFILAFFLAFANTGFSTFYQNNIPINIMGRVVSIYGLIEAVFIIIITIGMGTLTHFYPLQWVVIGGALIMMVLALILCAFTFHSTKKKVNLVGYFTQH